MRRIVVMICLLAITLNLFSGCGTSKKESTYDTFITVDVFCAQANYQGIQAGWFGEIVKQRFNMELNIIAPNVAGGGDALYQTRLAAGDLGDIVMIGAENGQLEDMVEAGLLLDMTPYKADMYHVSEYPEAIEMIQNLLGDDSSFYAMPSEVTSYEASEPSESTEPTFGPYIRWDLYQTIGAPSLNTLEDLLPTLKKMQELYPVTESGDKTYGFSLFKDWDDNMMMMAKQPACLYGYDEVGFLLSKVDGSDTCSIIEEDSPYIRSLKLYYEANQIGLLDPDSREQTWDDVWDKYEEGSILFSFWPWLGQSAFNTVDRMNDGKGYMLVPIEDMSVLSYGATPTGKDYIVGIGSKTKDPERMADFIDWLYSPEGIMLSTSQTGSSCGPEGLTWQMLDGRPVLTEFGEKAMLEGGANMPESYGGGTWAEGISQLNFTAVQYKDINPETGFSYDFRTWESYIEKSSTTLQESWQKHTGYETTFDYLIHSDMLMVDPGNDYIAKPETNEISTLRAQCKAVIQEISWKMVYASDQKQFEQLLDDMQRTLKELGYYQVLDYDLLTAKELNAARAEAIQ